MGDCRHLHWKIGDPHEGQAEGVCQHCGEVRMFRTLMTPEEEHKRVNIRWPRDYPWTKPLAEGVCSISEPGTR